ncbi:MAG TPA: hypothetical protein VF867_20080 [Arthrobacter sp.]
MSWDKTKDQLREQTVRQTNKRKNTAKWCRGKVGVEHVTEIVINHNYTNTRGCNWYPIYYSFKRRAEGPRDYRYWCKHSLRCTNCGKYTEIFLGVEQCPDASPRPE